jgi:carboxyl-terminal processing protease
MRSRKIIFALLVAAFVSTLCTAQSFDGIERGRMKAILKVVKDEVKKNYYDPAYRGIDLEARFKKADASLDQVKTTDQALGIIAQTLLDFDDSHLFLSPPPTNLSVEYGWRMSMIGDKCFVTAIKPGSDADVKGLKAGDQILGINGFRPSRKELWKVLYYYNTISKRSHLALSIISPGETTPKDLDIQSIIKKQPRTVTFKTYFRFGDDFYNEENDKHRFYRVGGVGIWRMPSFEFDPVQVDSIMNRFDGTNGLVLDLRGNPGGYVKTLEELAGRFVEKDTKIADLKGRKPMEPQLAKARKSGRYSGRIVVLLDSNSGSAAEILGRFLQIEKRGVVLGDVSAGAVMQSRAYDEQVGGDYVVPFGVSITNADVIMTDGQSLEHVGVQPDQALLLSGEDLRKGRDPVMAAAVALLGGTITPEDAGKFVTYYW